MSNALPLPAKITLATFKSFVRKNRSELFIKVRGSFDGMTDGVEFDSNATFKPAKDSLGGCPENDLGIGGVWLVKGSRDYFKAFEGEGFYGIEVSNCCGYFTVAIKVESATQSEAIPEPPSNIIPFRKIA
jgi:hypothetical protein